MKVPFLISPVLLLGASTILTPVANTSPTPLEPLSPGATSAHLFGVARFDGEIHAAGRNRTVLRSDEKDGWIAEELDAEGASWRGISTDGERLVVVGRNGTVAVSSDGSSWQIDEEASEETLTRSAHLGGYFWALGEEGGLMRSLNGIAWETLDSGTDTTLRGIAHDPDSGLYVLVGDSGNVAVSSDADFWQAHATQADWEFRDVAFGHEGFLAVAGGGLVLQSSDGESWTPSANPLPHDHLGGIAYGSGQYVIAGGLGRDTRFYVSNDGETWQEAELPLPVLVTDLVFDGEQFLAAGYSGSILQSANGLDWEIRHTAIRTDIFAFTDGSNDARMAVGEHGQILRATEDHRWERLSLRNSSSLLDIAEGNETLVAVGDRGVILRSPDGVHWHRTEIADAGRLGSVAFGDGQFIVVGEEGTVLRSEGGENWDISSLPGDRMYWSLAYGDGTWIAAGENAAVVSSDGITWEEVLFDESVSLNSVVFHEGEGFVAAGSMFAAEGPEVTTELAGWLAHTVDGREWQVAEPDPGYIWVTAASGTGWIAAFDPHGNAALSADGKTWEVQELLPAENPFASAGWMNAVTIGNDGATAIGRDAMTHVFALPPLLRQLLGEDTVDLHGAIALSAETGGTGPFTYQWFHDGEPINGESDPDLHLSDVGRDAIGDYRLRASGPGGEAFSPPVLVVVRFDYDAWAAEALGESAPPETSSPEADPLGIGVANLVAYAFDTAPADARALMPAADIEMLLLDGEEAAYPTLTFVRSLGIDDLEYLPESSTNLSDWTPLTEEHIVRVKREGSREFITVRTSTPLNDPDTPRFFRLSLSLPE